VVSAGNPALPRRSGGERQLPFAAVLVGAVFLALTAALTIATLRSAADSSRRAETLVAHLESTVHEQAALELGALARGGLTPAEVGDLQAARSRVGEILADLALDERSSFGLAGLRAALEAYRSALDEQLAALGADDLPGAAAIEAGSVKPARDTFRRVREATVTRLDTAATDSSTAAEVGTMTSLLSSAILASLLFRRWERARRRSAFLVGERLGLRESEARFRGLVQHSSDLITVVGRDGVLAYVSPSAGRLLEATAAALAGTPAVELVHPDDRRRLDELLAGSPEEINGRTVEWRLRTGDGLHLRQGWRTFESTVSSVDPSDPTSAIILNSRDVTDRRALEESLRHQAGHDPLTDLLNRAVLLDSMERALHRAGRNRMHVALLFIDLDAFKDINDSAGHIAGDAALVELGSRIRRIVRADAVVARIGGDEFALLLEDLDDASQAVTVADRLLAAIDRPLEVAGVERRIGASIGIALNSDELVDAPALLAAADRAMYEAKRAGGGRHALFEGRLSGPGVA
jgi:diguanylate cyclase (GGDEF)-like protein/PAS domain S-box-containing protein